MRTLLAVATLSTTLLLAGCSDAGSSSGATPATSTGSGSASAPASPSASAQPDVPFTPAPAGPDVAAGEACAAIRAGIDAFNLGVYEETVQHFQEALPLAQKADDGSLASAELTEAVRYYAGLSPDDYLKASATSPDFAKYKAITLSQCAGQPSAPSSSTGVEA